MRQKTTYAGVTFAVADVERATSPLPELPYSEVLSQTLGVEGVRSLESYSYDTKTLVTPVQSPYVAHPFLHAVNLAYDDHRPLVLSPDMIWLLIAQGVALHIRANAETLRPRFVAHSGKAEIEVVRNEFVRDFIGNDWEGVFAEFSARIREHIGEKSHRAIVQRFSTTGIVEEATFAITLMDAFQSYFSYSLVTLCGIPAITLEGIPADWQKVRDCATTLDQYELRWWLKHLLPVLDQFVAASQETVDVSFWRDFYKINDSSGGPYVNGHIVNLFPYLTKALPAAGTIAARRQSLHRQRLTESEIEEKLSAQYQHYGKPIRNTHLGWQASGSHGAFEGIKTNELPSPLSKAPFIWNYVGTKLPMELVAGFIGVTQNQETLAVRPEIGWAVRNRSA